MASWRKNQGISNRHVGHRRYSSYNGKPPLDNRFSTIPWRRVLESHSNVMNWEDYAVKQVVYGAKFRFWAEINDFRCEPNPACGWGWGAEEEVTKPPGPSYAADGWGSNNHENNETNSWEENDSQRWIPQEQYGGEMHNKYQTQNGENINWGGYNRNISWSKKHAYQHGTNYYKMNRGRRNGGRGEGGGKRGNYNYAAKVTSPRL